MIGRKFRLPLGKESMRDSKSAPFPLFLLKRRPSEAPHNRYAVVVGAKVSSSSVVRHFVKRAILREVALWPARTPRGAYDMLYIVSPRAGTIPKKEIPRALRESLARAKELVFADHP